MSFARQYAQHTKRQQAAANKLHGYYLVKESDDSRHYISASADRAALERVCDKVLTDTDFDYWVDRYYGADVNGCASWANVDLTDLFFFSARN